MIEEDARRMGANVGMDQGERSLASTKKPSKSGGTDC